MSARTLLVRAALAALAASAACGDSKLHPVTKVSDGGPRTADDAVGLPPSPPPFRGQALQAALCATEILRAQRAPDEALEELASASLPCELAIPEPRMGELDFETVNVTLVGRADVRLRHPGD